MGDAKFQGQIFENEDDESIRRPLAEGEWATLNIEKEKEDSEG